MQTVSNDNFGPLIAYLVPGATALAGVSQFSPVLQSWFAAVPPDAPTIGGFLYVTAASLAIGMVISAVRWAVVDTAHRLMGLQAPRLDFSTLDQKVEALALLIDIHYRHYLYYANMFVALGIAYACYRATQGDWSRLGWMDIGFAVLEVILFVTSRDTLGKYYARSQQLLGPRNRGAH